MCDVALRHHGQSKSCPAHLVSTSSNAANRVGGKLIAGAPRHCQATCPKKTSEGAGLPLCKELIGYWLRPSQAVNQPDLPANVEMTETIWGCLLESMRLPISTADLDSSSFFLLIFSERPISTVTIGSINYEYTFGMNNR